MLQAERRGRAWCSSTARSAQYLPPRARPTQFRQILELLDKPQPASDTDVGAILHDVAERIKRRGLVIIISDLIDDEAKIADGLQHFRHNNHEVVVFQVLDDAELTFPYDRLTRFKDMEGAGRVVTEPQEPAGPLPGPDQRVHRRRSRPPASSAGSATTWSDTKQPYDQFLAAYLEKRARMG